MVEKCRKRDGLRALVASGVVPTVNSRECEKWFQITALNLSRHTVYIEEKNDKERMAK